MRKLFLLVFLLPGLFYSCSKETDPIPGPVAGKDTWAVNKTDQYSINVVFFNPSGFGASAKTLDDISNMMLYIQKWYEVQMDLQGFGKKTFGLVTNQQGKVRIHLVNGKQPASYYVNLGGHAEILQEINAYFSGNPGFKAEGQHMFILGSRNSGVPFYGLTTGRMAFATSDDFKLTTAGKYIGELELKICPFLGGIIHELGHGLNLPHNCHKASDLPKIALMSYGNQTYQDVTTVDKVFLTKADCAILDVNEAFNKKGKLYYGANPNIVLKSFSVKKDAGKRATIVNGILTSDIRATWFYAGHDGSPAGGNNDYDKINFTGQLVPTANANEYSFYVEIPYQEIFNGYKAKDALELSMSFVVENGNIGNPSALKYDYSIGALSPEPNDDIQKEYTPHLFSNRSKWTITANSSGSGPTPASNMIDGNVSTIWHSAWNYNINASGNHVININMGETKEIKGVYLYSDRAGDNYRPKHLMIETSTDGTNWVKAKEASYSSTSAAREVSGIFTIPLSGKYIRMTIDQVFTPNTQENLIFAEIDIL